MSTNDKSTGTSSGIKSTQPKTRNSLIKPNKQLSFRVRKDSFKKEYASLIAQKKNLYIIQNKEVIQLYQNQDNKSQKTILLKHNPQIKTNEKSFQPKHVILGVDEGLIEVEQYKTMDKKWLRQSITFKQSPLKLKSIDGGVKSPKGLKCFEENSTETFGIETVNNIPLIHKRSKTNPNIALTSTQTDNGSNVKRNQHVHKKQDIENNQRYIHEIRKLNNWDLKHSISERKKTQYHTSLDMQIFLNSIGQSSLRWGIEIKNDPKQVEALSKNKYLLDFFTKIDKEQKAISLQNISINKQNFNFDVFVNRKSEEPVKKDKKNLISHVDFYREVMREKIKIEELGRSDGVHIAQDLYNYKQKKKKMIIDLFEAAKDINRMEKEKEDLKGKNKIETEEITKRMNDDFINNINRRDSLMRGNRNTEFFEQIKKNNKKQIKDQKFIHKNEVLAICTENAKKMNEKIQKINIEKEEYGFYINNLNREIGEISQMIQRSRMKLNQRIDTYRRYYTDILKKGIDVRRDGLQWAVAKGLAINTFVDYSMFPIFLNKEQNEYIKKMAYKQHEISEGIKGFQVLKSKQKKIRDECHGKAEEQINNFEGDESEDSVSSKKNKDETIQNGYIEEIEAVAKRYENVIQTCINETQEDKYIAKIIKDGHKKIIELYENDIGNKEDDTAELYFLPGSGTEKFNFDNKFRMYFDDIYYGNKQIREKERLYKEEKESAVKEFRKKKMNSKFNQIDSTMDERIFSAMFGNGINI